MVKCWTFRRLFLEVLAILDNYKQDSAQNQVALLSELHLFAEIYGIYPIPKL